MTKKIIKPKFWDGASLEGTWLITRKLDGVRMLRDEKGNPVSRSGKPLYNLDHIPKHITDAEIFCGSWEETVSRVRTQDGTPIDIEDVYSLYPLEARLIIGSLRNLTPEIINVLLDNVLLNGDEGLVLHDIVTNKAYKIKPIDNYDVTVLDVIEGKGKRKNSIGKLITPMGNIGIFKGFTDDQLRDLWLNRKERLINKTVEVECMQLTPTGKFRHGKLVRERFDK
jgi:hypothetical protein